jgi:hypothetical protein
MNGTAAVVPVIVGSDNTLMPAEMLTGELHSQLLRLLYRQPALYVLRVKAENKVVLLDILPVTILFPEAVADLAVNAVSPRGGVDSVNQHVFPEMLDVVFIIDGSGMTIVLEQDVGDKIVIITAVNRQMLENRH